MEFKATAAVNDEIINRAKHKIYAYTKINECVDDAIIQCLKRKTCMGYCSFVLGVVTSISQAVQAFTETE